MKVIVMSSLAQNTGCWLRAQYVANSLRAKVKIIKPFKKSLPMMLDLILSIPINFFKIAFKKADVIIAIKPFPNVTIPMIAKKILSRNKIVIDIDDLDSGYRKGILAKINSFTQRPFPRHFDIVSYHNPLLYQYIQKEFKVRKERLYKLEQGVNLKIFNYKIKDANLRKKFAKNNEKVIVFVGHLNIASDLDDIIRAMKIVQGRIKAIFIIAGGGPEEKNFMRLAKKLKVKAIFTGHLSKEEIVKYISISDLCLVYYKDKPANYYRCSMKIRECMAMGKKIVCNDVGELKEFRKYTYQTNSDLKKYAEKIISVLKSGDGREIKAREYVRKNFDWDKIGSKLTKRLKE